MPQHTPWYAMNFVLYKEVHQWDNRREKPAMSLDVRQRNDIEETCNRRCCYKPSLQSESVNTETKGQVL